MRKLEHWVVVVGMPLMLISIIAVISIGVYLYKNNIVL